MAVLKGIKRPEISCKISIVLQGIVLPMILHCRYMQNCLSCEAKLQQMDFFAPRTMSAASVKNIMYALVVKEFLTKLSYNSD